MISVQALTHRYPGRRGQPPRVALDDVTLTLAEGTFGILSGPNGSGKSTLFRILCGAVIPSSGTVTLGGEDLLANPAAARARLGVVFQSPAVDKQLTVQENLKLHGDLYGLDRVTFTARQREALAWSDLEGRLDDRVGTLSGGLARQVELAKCLLTHPRVLLLDEPTTGLDPASRLAFLTALRRLQREQGITVLMTSHIFDEAEEADQVAVMQAGRLLAVDSPAALRAMLGREMLVVETETPAAVLARLTDVLPATAPVVQRPAEFRVEDLAEGAALPLLETVLERCRADVRSVGIRRPGLEDVFVHLTRGADLEEDESACA